MAIGKENYVHLNNGELSKDYSVDDLKNLFQKFKDHQYRDKLVLHFHGGLVDCNSAMKGAEILKPKFEGGEAYPVFFIWNSALLDTLRNNLVAIVKESIYKIIFGHIKSKHRELSNKKSTDLTAEEENKFKNQLEQDESLNKEVRKIIEDSGKDAKKKTLMSQEVLEELRKDDKESKKGGYLRIIVGIIGVLKEVLKRLNNGRDHGFEVTIMEEIFREFYLGSVGQAIWHAMKEDTTNSFKDNGGGTLFLKEIEKGWQNGDKPRIILVGHSAGAVFICNLLEAVEKQKLPDDLKFDIIFIAPACTFKCFADILSAYQSRIANFRLFGLQDMREKKDKAFIYPHSLLYFISGVLEDKSDKPLVGMERYYTDKTYDNSSDIKKVRDYINEDWRVWSIVDKGFGKASKATTHGGFDKEETTVKSIVEILLNGYQNINGQTATPINTSREIGTDV